MNIEEIQVRECARQIKKYCTNRECLFCIFLDVLGYCTFKDGLDGKNPEEWQLPTELKKGE